jgi:hypothetical protein
MNEQIEHLRLDVDNRSSTPQFVPRDVDLELGEAKVHRNPRGWGAFIVAEAATFQIIGAVGVAPYTTFKKCSRKAHALDRTWSGP